jgi:hypothetical protein
MTNFLHSPKALPARSYLAIPTAISAGCSKRFRGEARQDKDESGRMKAEMFSFSAFSFHNSAFVLFGEPFSSLLMHDAAAFDDK